MKKLLLFSALLLFACVPLSGQKEKRETQPSSQKSAKPESNAVRHSQLQDSDKSNFDDVFTDDKNEELYLWPIKGAKRGTNIISAPQGYLGDELNFDDIFIAAPEGTPVYCPVDGTITTVSVFYYHELSYLTSWNMKENFDETIKAARIELETDPDKSFKPKYVSGIIRVKCNDGNTVSIRGLTGTETFKSGQKIIRGTLIGKVAYPYHKIEESAISISISRDSKSADPMTPFGIKSSYIPPMQAKPITSLTQEQAKEDFTIYIDALKEIYPGVYDVVTPEELEQYVSQITTEIDKTDKDLDIAQFWDIMHRTTAKIHDSHIYLHHYEQPADKTYRPAIEMGWIQGELICTNAWDDNYRKYWRKKIESVNGITADSLKKIIEANVEHYDAQVESYKEYQLATFGYRILSKPPYGNPRFDMQVVFAGGEKADIKGVKLENPEDGIPSILSQSNFINRQKPGYYTKIINDSVALLGISTFSLNEVQVEEIGTFIKSISGKNNLIVDIRNNGGGSGEVLSKLYSYIAGEPFTLYGYSKVNKTGHFESFKYSLNRIVEDELFSAYKAEEGKEGYYLRQDSGTLITPHPTINYKGRIYMLTNENSVSAAAMFPALLIRNHRGVIVGRETRTAYHFMNAVKFADLILPNSSIKITVPLVCNYFDTIVNNRVPYGRGVIPDYVVPITLEELLYMQGDAILNYTLGLITVNAYIKGKDPFKNEDKSKGFSIPALAAGGLLVAGCTAVFIHRRRKSRYNRLKNI